MSQGKIWLAATGTVLAGSVVASQMKKGSLVQKIPLLNDMQLYAQTRGKAYTTYNASTSGTIKIEREKLENLYATGLKNAHLSKGKRPEQTGAISTFNNELDRVALATHIEALNEHSTKLGQHGFQQIGTVKQSPLAPLAQLRVGDKTNLIYMPSIMRDYRENLPKITDHKEQVFDSLLKNQKLKTVSNPTTIAEFMFRAPSENLTWRNSVPANWSYKTTAENDANNLRNALTYRSFEQDSFYGNDMRIEERPDITNRMNKIYADVNKNYQGFTKADKTKAVNALKIHPDDIFKAEHKLHAYMPFDRYAGAHQNLQTALQNHTSVRAYFDSAPLLPQGFADDISTIPRTAVFANQHPLLARLSSSVFKPSHVKGFKTFAGFAGGAMLAYGAYKTYSQISAAYAKDNSVTGKNVLHAASDNLVDWVVPDPTGLAQKTLKPVVQTQFERAGNSFPYKPRLNDFPSLTDINNLQKTAI